MHAWRDKDFIRDFNSGANPMQQIASQVAKYWNKKRQNRLISIMEGRMTYASLHAGDDGLTMGYSVIYATQDELKELNGFNKERELVWDGRQFR